MYKYFGIALLGIFATMLIPISAESSTGPTFYGIASVTTFDSTGNPTSTQTVHNALINLGEQYVVEQLFQETSTAVADNAQIASICLTETASYNSVQTPDETQTVAGFDTDQGPITAATNCIEDTAVDVSANGIAKIDAGLTFNEGTHADLGDPITAIGICPAIVTGGPAFDTCANAGAGSNTLLFAIVNITDFTLGSGESATITYTFDVDE